MKPLAGGSSVIVKPAGVVAAATEQRPVRLSVRGAEDKNSAQSNDMKV